MVHCVAPFGNSLELHPADIKRWDCGFACALFAHQKAHDFKHLLKHLYIEIYPLKSPGREKVIDCYLNHILQKHMLHVRTTTKRTFNN